MAYYGKPRMTRDLDIVVSLGEDDVGSIVAGEHEGQLSGFQALTDDLQHFQPVENLRRVRGRLLPR
jgi:hypothetical protein